MRILHVIATLAASHGGPSKACLDMAAALARRGHDVHVYSTNYEGPGLLDVPLDRAIDVGGAHVRYFAVGRPRFWKLSWPLARALRDSVAGFDVVHIHSLYLFHDWVAAHYCRRYGVPYVVRPHGALDPYIFARHRWRKFLMDRIFQNRALRGAARIVYASDEESRLAAPYAQGTAGAVAPLGLDTAQYADLPPRGEFRARYPELADAKIVLFFGRINFKKGLDVLAPAFARVVAQVPDARLVIAGPDSDGFGDRVRQWLRREGVLGHALFTGMLAGREKLAVLRDADVFVLPSYSENFGIAVVEAMACGLAVVISDKVNIWREIAQAKAGWVVPLTIEATADALVAALTGPAEAARAAAAGKALVRARFDWQRNTAALEAVYAQVTEAASRRTSEAPGRDGR